MADNLSSASTASVVPAAVHKSIVADLLAEIAVLEADAAALWTGKSVYVIGIAAFVAGLIVRSVL